MIPKGSLLTSLEKVGFQHTEDVILVFTGGSKQHGAYIEDAGDLDIFGVFVEHPSKMLGLDKEEHFITGTSDNSVRNTSEDEDFKMYGLRHWAAQAAKGNPTALGFLFCPTNITDPATTLSGYYNNCWQCKILPNKGKFLASSHAAAFLGYGQGQLRRLKGQGTGRHGQRTELITIYGYDSKAAMHMIRMGYECLELLKTGHITYPRPEKEILVDIRQGGYSLENLEKWYFRLEEEIRTAEKQSPLPRKVDRQQISDLITDSYLLHWSEKGLLKG